MKLSILIPVYNAECFIERCLNSLIMQDIDKSDYEIIVYNDGSTDNSLELIKNYSKQHNNIVFYSHENQGAVATRNKLLKLAKGTYIYFVDADDYVTQNSLSRVLNYAMSNSLDIIGFNALVTNRHEAIEVNETTNKEASFEILTGPQFLKDNKNIRLEIWWYLIRKDFLDESNIYFDRSDYDGDVVFTLRLFLKAKKVAYSPALIYCYFQTLESTMRTNNNASKRRIIDYFVALIIDFSGLINSLNKNEISYKDTIKNNFKFRRSAFTFFTIVKMIKANLPISKVKANINQLEVVNAYPICDFISEDYNSISHRFLTYIFNHKQMLYMAVRIFNISGKLMNLKSDKLNK